MRNKKRGDKDPLAEHHNRSSGFQHHGQLPDLPAGLNQPPTDSLHPFSWPPPHSHQDYTPCHEHHSGILRAFKAKHANHGRQHISVCLFFFMEERPNLSPENRTKMEGRGSNERKTLTCCFCEAVANPSGRKTKTKTNRRDQVQKDSNIHLSLTKVELIYH